MKNLTLAVARYLPHLGGIEIHVAELARRAADAGWRVTVATLADQPSTGSQKKGIVEEEKDGVRILRFPAHLAAGGHQVWSPSLWRFLREGAADADVVHLHNYHAAVVVPALAAAGARGARVVFTPHYLGVGESAAARAQHAAYRRVIGPVLRRHQPTMIHVSHTEAEEFRRDLGAAAPREVHVVPNGVRVSDLEAATAHPVAGRLILAASRLEPYKQVDLVVRALPHLPEDTWLAVAGDGPQRADLEALAGRLGVAPRVRMLGRLSWEELTSWYRAAEVFVSMSDRECYGMAVAEALAAGTGVVASDIPPHREVLAAAGYPADLLVPTDAVPAQVAAAVERARAQRAAPGARPSFTWDDMAQAVLSIYGSRARS